MKIGKQEIIGKIFPDDNSTNAISFTDTEDNSILSIDTLNKRIGINDTIPDSTLVIKGTNDNTCKLVNDGTSDVITFDKFSYSIKPFF